MARDLAPQIQVLELTKLFNGQSHHYPWSQRKASYPALLSRWCTTVLYWAISAPCSRHRGGRSAGDTLFFKSRDKLHAYPPFKPLPYDTVSFYPFVPSLFCGFSACSIKTKLECGRSHHFSAPSCPSSRRIFQRTGRRKYTWQLRHNIWTYGRDDGFWVPTDHGKQNTAGIHHTRITQTRDPSPTTYGRYECGVMANGGNQI